MRSVLVILAHVDAEGDSLYPAADPPGIATLNGGLIRVR
jgi:hypothetical protein